LVHFTFGVDRFGNVFNRNRTPTRSGDYSGGVLPHAKEYTVTPPEGSAFYIQGVHIEEPSHQRHVILVGVGSADFYKDDLDISVFHGDASAPIPHVPVDWGCITAASGLTIRARAIDSDPDHVEAVTGSLRGVFVPTGTAADDGSRGHAPRGQLLAYGIKDVENRSWDQTPIPTSVPTDDDVSDSLAQPDPATVTEFVNDLEALVDAGRKCFPPGETPEWLEIAIDCYAWLAAEGTRWAPRTTRALAVMESYLSPRVQVLVFTPPAELSSAAARLLSVLRDIRRLIPRVPSVVSEGVPRARFAATLKAAEADVGSSRQRLHDDLARIEARETTTELSDADEKKRRLKLDPDLVDGEHWTISDVDAQLLESLRVWMSEASVGDSVTIELVAMTDEEVKALPDI
jgi:hypothetical protein